MHYGTEFLTALLDEQPMGFYPSDALVHEAQRRGIAVLAPDVNHSAVGCTVVKVDGADAVRIGLGYVMGVQAADIEALVAAREAAGPFRTVEELASRAGAGRPALEQLAWSGACDALAGGSRRRALWELGVAAPGKRLLTSVVGASGRRTRAELGTQLALPLGVGEAPALPGLTGWEAMIADYSTTGLTTAEHPLGLLRAELRAQKMVASSDLERLGHGTAVRIGGLVVARQRPGTAKGVCFLLMEDEAGTVNLIVPPKVYERDRLVVRAEPLVVAEGVLERHASAGGAINIVAGGSCAWTPVATCRHGRRPMSPSTTSPRSPAASSGRAERSSRSRTSRCSTRSSWPARRRVGRPPRTARIWPRQAPGISVRWRRRPRASHRVGGDAGLDGCACGRRAVRVAGPGSGSGLALGTGSPDRVPHVIGTLVFVLIFLAVGLAVVLAAMRSGRPPAGSGPESRGTRRAWSIGIALVILVVGIGVPLLIAVSNSEDHAKHGAGGVEPHRRRRPRVAGSSPRSARPATRWLAPPPLAVSARTSTRSTAATSSPPSSSTRSRRAAPTAPARCPLACCTGEEAKDVADMCRRLLAATERASVTPGRNRVAPDLARADSHDLRNPSWGPCWDVKAEIPAGCGNVPSDACLTMRSIGACHNSAI